MGYYLQSGLIPIRDGHRAYADPISAVASRRHPQVSGLRIAGDLIYRSVWLIILLILLSWVGASAAQIENSRHPEPAFTFDRKQALNLATFNIRVGYGSGSRGTDPYTLSKRSEKLGPVIEALRSLAPDILALQEVEGPDQVRRIANALNMNHAYAGHATGNSLPSWWGIAVLSRFPIAAAEDFPISRGRGDCKSALQCTIRITGRPITVICIHKDRDIKDNRPMERIMARVAGLSDPVVLMGDFNMRPEDSRLRLLHSRFRDSACEIDSGSARTARRIGTFRGVGRIDYIWFESSNFRIAAAGLADRRFNKASDHIAYWVSAIPTF